MKSYEARPGVMVRVRKGHRKSELEGMLGTIKQTFGHPDYAAVDVLLDNGQLELFWYHQLEKAD